MTDRDEEYSKQETKRRFEAALRGARLVGHKPQSEMKLGKPKAKPKARRKPGKKP